MLGHVAGPRAGVAVEMFPNLLDHRVQESAGADRRIEDLHLVHPGLGLDDSRARLVLAVRRIDLQCLPAHFGAVGQTVAQLEGLLQQRIDAAHDVADHRLRGVVDAAGFAHLLVVGGQKGFVEVHDRVFLPGALAEILQDRGHVGAGQQLRELVDCPGDAFVEVRTCDRVEQLAKEGVGPRQHVGRRLSRERLPGRGATRSEQAIAQGLRVHVGELIGRQRFDQDATEGFELVVQIAFGTLGAERLLDEAADQLRKLRHARRQILRRRLQRQVRGDELAEQLRNLAGRVVIPADAPILARTRQRCAEPQFAIKVPLEVEIIGEHEVAERSEVALHLLAAGDLPQIDADVLGLDVAQRHHAASENEIRRPAGDALRLVDGVDAFPADGLEQRFQRWPMGVLGGIAGLDRTFDRGQVVTDHVIAFHVSLHSFSRRLTDRIGIKPPSLHQPARAGRTAAG